MFAISFDLVVAEVARKHPRGVASAYSEIGATLQRFGFERVQGSVYITQRDDMANLFSAILALNALPWFPESVRDIRGFRIEHWSDFTPLIKGAGLP